MKLNIPERFTGTIYICVYSNPASLLYGRMHFQPKDPSNWKGDDSQIVVGKVEVDIPLDTTGTLDKHVSDLQAAKQKIIDEATERAGQIDEAIESLLALEYKESDA